MKILLSLFNDIIYRCVTLHVQTKARNISVSRLQWFLKSDSHVWYAKNKSLKLKFYTFTDLFFVTLNLKATMLFSNCICMSYSLFVDDRDPWDEWLASYVGLISWWYSFMFSFALKYALPVWPVIFGAFTLNLPHVDTVVSLHALSNALFCGLLSVAIEPWFGVLFLDEQRSRNAVRNFVDTKLYTTGLSAWLR